MARPTKLDEQLIEAIATAVAACVPPEKAAKALGIGQRTWYDWLARGRTPSGPADSLCVELLERIERARGFAYMAVIRNLGELSKRDVRAALVLLERLDRIDQRGAQAATGAPQVIFEVHGKAPTKEEPTRASVVFEVVEDASDAEEPGQVIEPQRAETPGSVVVDIRERRRDDEREAAAQ